MSNALSHNFVFPSTSVVRRGRWYVPLAVLALLASLPWALSAAPAPAAPGTPGNTIRLAPTAMHFKTCCYASSIAAADLRGNGRLDMVIGNAWSLDISVLLNDGAGGYAAPLTLPLDNGTNGFVVVAIGDVTGDGHPDIVAAGISAHDVVVFAGDGAGGFLAPVSHDLGDGEYPRDLKLIDINGDGHLDIVTANGDSSSLSVLLGDGAGGFATARNFPTGAFPTSLALADVDGDGHLDAVTANTDTHDLSLLLGDGKGGFSAPVTLPLGPDAEPFGVAIADVTGDGVPDIVTANRTWDDSPFPPPELAGTVSVLAGTGGGKFAPAVQLSLGDLEGRAHSVAIADVTGDGLPDIVVTRPLANTVSVLASDGAGGFAPALNRPTGVGPTPLLIADITADGHPDIVTGNAISGSVSVLPGDGSGGIGFAGNSASGAYPHSVAAVDLNGDGHPDVVTANLDSNDISVLINDGKGGFAAEVRYAVGHGPTWVTVGDLNSDGHPDLVVANLGETTVSVLLGDGKGGFSAAQAFSVASSYETPYAVALGDANGDGHLDIVTANTNLGSDSVSLLLGDGKGHFAAASVFAVGGAGVFGPNDIVLADVTGDGHADIVTANSSADNLSLLVGDGKGGFANAVHIDTAPGPVALVAADMTGNGRLDLVVLNQPAQAVSVFTRNDAGGFEQAGLYPIYPPEEQMEYEPWPWGLAVADVDGDGTLDIVTANTENDTVSVLPNDGSGAFNRYYNFDTGAHPGAVAVADIDGDGRADVITANRRNNNISVLFNLGGDGDSDFIFSDGFEGFGPF